MGRCYYPSWIKVKKKKSPSPPPPNMSSPPKKDHRSAIDAERANELFNHFTSHANTMKSILAVFRLLCETLRLKPAQFPLFYPKLRAHLCSWKANAIWAKLDKRSGQRTYGKGSIAAGQRVLVIGAGPCGLRTAIEAQLLGAKVIVIEKRDRFSRNNVLHLWPYNIFDLKGIAAKKFYGKFCAGSIDHISIRQLQCILLKVALLLGVEVFENASFEGLIEPSDEETAWKAKVTPSDHPVSLFEFDVLMGADGKRNTLTGFKRKEFRGKLAIAITVNFINRHSEMESMVEEISGVAFIFNQKFFNDLNEAKGIDLENIVYYRDETHYFVMTAKKQSLLNKGVILSNEPDTAKLLSPSNIDQEALFQFAREAADYATDYKLPKLDFAVNHYGKPDVAMFDFTSMFQAENSCRIIERKGHRLLTCLVGDSLLEPFWPTGTGCARGFFGGFDAIWSLRSLCLGKLNPLQVLAERESIYRLLAQTTPENTCKDYTAYSLDPCTRYTTHNSRAVLPFQVLHLFDTDDQEHLQEMLKESSSATDNSAIKRRSRDETSSTISHSALLSWFQKCTEAYPEELVPRISDLTTSFRDGRVLCAVIHRYRPYLIGDLESICLANDPARNNEIAFDILEHDLGIQPVMTGGELAKSSRPDTLTMISYLSAVHEVFSRDLPLMKRPVSIPEEEVEAVMALNAKNRIVKHKSNKNESTTTDSKHPSIGQLVAGEVRKTKKRRSGENADDALDNSLPDKENIRTKRRMAKLLEASNKNNSGKKSSHNGEIRSIKKENRYKVIEEQFEGGPKRKLDPVTKYRENKKPKELRRAIGKIDKEDWNIKNIEDKLHLNKNESEMTSPLQSSKKDKVPKWSKAAFQDKFNIMKDKLENKVEEGKSKERRKKINDIDNSLARLQKKLREGSTLETGQRGRNKVSALASELFAKSSSSSKKEEDNSVPAEVASNPERTKKNSFTAKTGSETCHFCSKRVYVVERMSAEGKFFHRSCFRCDYCNILLRLGSYVYKRDGILGGKFFCIPHYTETYMEKYRFRRKEDEIRDVEQRRRDGIRRAMSDLWKDKGDAKSPAKERLLSSLDIQDRGATPERAEFEASIDLGKRGVESRRNKPAIMDEDEWTDRNFGNSTLGSDEDGVDTSDDSVSDLDSDSDGESRAINEDRSRPLTADEARQLQREWIKKYDRHSDSYIDSSDDESVNYEDGEYESSDESESSSSTESSDTPEKQYSRMKASRPVRKSRQDSDSGSSTEEFVSENDDASLSSEEEFDGKLSEFYNSEFDRSESNTECEFTDSEGRPNPFHKEIDSSKRPVAKSPLNINKIMVINPDHVSQVISLDTKYALVDPKKYQYKTPNISDRLKKQQQVDSVCVNSNISSRRALNLKKNWATGNNGFTTTSSTLSNKVSNSADVDNRLKSLMDRLSNQQKLLKPAENAAPSKEMQHLLQSSMNLRARSDATQNGVPFSLNAVSTANTNTRSPFISTSLNSVPPIYKPLAEVKSSNKSPGELEQPHNANETTANDTPINSISSSASSTASPQNYTPEVLPSKESGEVHSTQTHDINKNTGDSLMEDSTSSGGFMNHDSPSMFEDSPVNQKGEDEEEGDPPDLEPIIEAINSVEIKELTFPKEEVEEEDVFESCNEDEDLVAVEAVNEELLSKSTTSLPPLTQSVIESQPNNAKDEEMSPPPVTLTDDEITRIYRERNPLEKIAKMNLYKQRQSSVIHDLIMSNRGNSKSPRRSARVGRSICTSPLPPPPPPPLEDEPLPPTNINTLDLPLIDEDECPSPVRPKLPATPITDPEKFGIVRHRSNSKSGPSRNEQDGGEKKTKKTLMKSISGLFSSSSKASPEINNDNRPQVSSSSPGNSKAAPVATMEEDDSAYPRPFSINVSTPSTPPVPLSRKINIPKEEISNVIDSSGGYRRLHRDSNVPPEIVEKILRRGEPKTAKLVKEAQVKRVRRAQELHRQLEELDVSTRDVENRGVQMERRLRGEEEGSDMQEWFTLLAEKNALVRCEQELLVVAKDLELEDRVDRLEGQLRECLFLDSSNSVLRQGEIIKELLEITEDREKLTAMLEKDKKRYIKEDQDIEATMIAKGLRVIPVRKISAAN